MHAFIENFFNWAIMAQYGPTLLVGFFRTVWLALLVIVTGVGVGMLLALIRSIGIRPLNVLIKQSVDVIRALPPLVLIILLYFGLPYVGLRLGGFVVAWFSLSLVLVAFAEEIFWAGICAISKGQLEAARATGLTFATTMKSVVLPQAVRIAIPPLTSRLIAITKNTALASAIAVPELLGTAITVQSDVANTTPLMMAAIGYLLMIYPLVLMSKWVESRSQWAK
ncbi:amino acid ABC transporter permease [Salinicola rhizosphaerae]|uniref:Polar amino acid ABC transporter permease n=1 Tax=Salinicola rhizosphaerae TaxID=1443141 RepID=A0ABQ3DXM8_9GAMM|nr:amino acid ABC transporter permease [Salinicola rhizosphaerae]GHB17101.1 polar amino acid ABC transporter permease [Salinicola rhizosphaerae]